jgi:hypothetical protein
MDRRHRSRGYLIQGYIDVDIKLLINNKYNHMAKIIIYITEGYCNHEINYIVIKMPLLFV